MSCLNHANQPRFSLYRCNDAKALAEVINDEAACRQLKSLDVSCNFLRKEGGRALASCLFHLPHLQVLKLSDNSIYFEGKLDSQARLKTLIS